jgi:predicted ribosome-associated RNA-binding protein Tma20
VPMRYWMAGRPAAFEGETGAAGTVAALAQHPLLEADVVVPAGAVPFMLEPLAV